MLGRPITEQDTAATRKVAVVNQAFVRRFFKGQNPIGQHFGPDKIKYSATFEIVGVTDDVRYMTYGYKKAVRPMFWVPEAQTVQYDDPASDERRNLVALSVQHRALGSGQPVGHGGACAQGVGQRRSEPGALRRSIPTARW